MMIETQKLRTMPEYQQFKSDYDEYVAKYENTDNYKQQFDLIVDMVLSKKQLFESQESIIDNIYGLLKKPAIVVFCVLLALDLIFRIGNVWLFVGIAMLIGYVVRMLLKKRLYAKIQQADQFDRDYLHQAVLVKEQQEK